jgi:hypothetical protein
MEADGRGRSSTAPCCSGTVWWCIGARHTRAPAGPCPTPPVESTGRSSPRIDTSSRCQQECSRLDRTCSADTWTWAPQFPFARGHSGELPSDALKGLSRFEEPLAVLAEGAPCSHCGVGGPRCHRAIGASVVGRRMYFGPDGHPCGIDQPGVPESRMTSIRIRRSAYGPSLKLGMAASARSLYIGENRR